MTVIYIDLLFLLNLIANYLLLLGVGRITGSLLHRGRIAAGAVLGAMYAVAVFLPGMGWATAWPCKIASGILMVLIAYGGQPGLLRVTILFFAASAALAGMVLGVELLGNTTLTVRNGVFYSQVDLRLLLVLFVLCYFLLSLIFRRMARHSKRELVELEIEVLGKQFRLTALKDSGHTLTDPATNKPVVVADRRCLQSVIPELPDVDEPVEALKRYGELGVKGARLVPYRAVGVDCGMLLALRTDSVRAEGRELGRLLLALSPTPVDDGGGYQALIGGIY